LYLFASPPRLGRMERAPPAVVLGRYYHILSRPQTAQYAKNFPGVPWPQRKKVWLEIATEKSAYLVYVQSAVSFDKACVALSSNFFQHLRLSKKGQAKNQLLYRLSLSPPTWGKAEFEVLCTLLANFVWLVPCLTRGDLLEHQQALWAFLFRVEGAFAV